MSSRSSDSPPSDEDDGSTTPKAVQHQTVLLPPGEAESTTPRAEYEQSPFFLPTIPEDEQTRDKGKGKASTREEEGIDHDQVPIGMRQHRRSSSYHGEGSYDGKDFPFGQNARHSRRDERRRSRPTSLELAHVVEEMEPVSESVRHRRATNPESSAAAQQRDTSTRSNRYVDPELLAQALARLPPDLRKKYHYRPPQDFPYLEQLELLDLANAPSSLPYSQDPVGKGKEASRGTVNENLPPNLHSSEYQVDLGREVTEEEEAHDDNDSDSDSASDKGYGERHGWKLPYVTRDGRRKYPPPP